MHGFNKKSKDMEPLAKNLAYLGHKYYLLDLPLTYKEFNFGVSILSDILEKIVDSDLTENEKICLVGHSTGGIIIRKLISEAKYNNKIGRCVLIASPNKGSQLADFAEKVKIYTKVFKTLESITYKHIKQLDFTCCPDIEIAAIAGNKSNLLLGKFIDGENDGRIEVQSVYYSELDDFVVLPYGHKDIHHRMETAKFVDSFLRTGKFN